MTAAAVTGSGAAPVPPDADPVAIRACLTPRMVAEFDAEWNIVLDQAKQSKDLAGVRDLLAKWRHFAYAEMRDPGTYFRLLAKAEQIQRTGRNPDAVPLEDMKALIEQRRRGQQVYSIVPDTAVMAQVAALPIAALDAYADVLDVLQLTPWNGEPQHKDNPDGAVRRWTFGPEDAGQIIYLILDEQREIHLLLVQWIG